MKKSKAQQKADEAFIQKIKSLHVGIKSVEVKECPDCGGQYLHVHGMMSVPLTPPGGNPANN